MKFKYIGLLGFIIFLMPKKSKDIVKGTMDNLDKIDDIEIDKSKHLSKKTIEKEETPKRSTKKKTEKSDDESESVPIVEKKEEKPKRSSKKKIEKSEPDEDDSVSSDNDNIACESISIVEKKEKSKRISKKKIEESSSIENEPKKNSKKGTKKEETELKKSNTTQKKKIVNEDSVLSPSDDDKVQHKEIDEETDTSNITAESIELLDTYNQRLKELYAEHKKYREALDKCSKEQEDILSKINKLLNKSDKVNALDMNIIALQKNTTQQTKNKLLSHDLNSSEDSDSERTTLKNKTSLKTKITVHNLTASDEDEENNDD